MTHELSFPLLETKEVYHSQTHIERERKTTSTHHSPAHRLSALIPPSLSHLDTC